MNYLALFSLALLVAQLTSASFVKAEVGEKNQSHVRPMAQFKKSTSQIFLKQSSSRTTFTADGGGVDLGDSVQLNNGHISSGGGTWITLTVGTVSISGSTDIQLTSDGCSGASILTSSCFVDFTFTPTSVGSKSTSFNYPWTGTYSDGNGGILTDGGVVTFVINGLGLNPPVENNQCAAGSLINVDNQSFTETIPLVGSDFNLVYSSEFTPEFVSDSSPITINHSFNLERWTISVMNLYDPANKRLFMGTGRSYSKKFNTNSSGNYVVVAPDGDEVYVFSPAGRHLQTRSALTYAPIYSFGYDSNGRLTSIQDAFGNTTTIARNSGGRMTSITAPHGQVTSMTRNSSGFLLTVTNPKSETYTMTYSGSTGLLSTFQKPGGQTSTFTYDSNGKLLRDLGNGGNYLDLSFSSGTITASSQMGRQTTHVGSFNSAGEYTRVTTYPSGLQTTSLEKPSGTRSSVDANEEIRETRVSDERFNGLFKRRDVLKTKLEGVESTTNFSQSVSGGTNAFDYTSLTRTATTSGHTKTAIYTASTKTWAFSSDAGETHSKTLNSYDQVVQAVHGSDTAHTFSYDSLGRLQSSQQGSKNQLTYAYDSLGNLQTITNGRSEATSFNYDLAGRLTQVTLPDSRVVQYQYDASGNLTGVTPPSRPQHGFQVNSFELVSQYQPPTLSGVSTVNTSYSYNMDKQLTQITRPTGQTAVFSYNATSGLLSSITVPAGTYSYAYQTANQGRVDSIQSPNGAKDVFTYRGYIRASDEQIRTSDSASMGKVSFGFNTNHKITSRSVQGNPSTTANTISITLNGDAEPTQVGDFSINYSYPSGRVSTTAIGIINDERTYDAYGNLESYTVKSTPTSGPETTLYSYTLTRDSMSRITGVSETVLGTTSTYAYTFDSAGRLTNVAKNSVNITTNSYDSNSNRTSGTIDGKSFTATYDNQDRMLAFGSRTYTYNSNGDLTSVQESSGATKTFTYDVFGNLLSTSGYSGKTYAYHTDGLNRRVAKFANSTGVARFLYDPHGRVVAQLDESGVVQKEFVYANPRAHHPVYMIEGSNKYRIITDHLGSLRLVVNVATGAVAQRMDYNVYGKVIRDTNSCFQPFGFAGGLYDADTKLVRFGARDYDPETGRWTSKDPILFKGGDVNLYSYVLNDPINFIDPEGTKLTPGNAIQIGIGGVSLVGGIGLTLSGNPFTGAGLIFIGGGLIIGGLIDAGIELPKFPSMDQGNQNGQEPGRNLVCR